MPDQLAGLNRLHGAVAGLAAGVPGFFAGWFLVLDYLGCALNRRG